MGFSVRFLRLALMGGLCFSDVLMQDKLPDRNRFKFVRELGLCPGVELSSAGVDRDAGLDFTDSHLGFSDDFDLYCVLLTIAEFGRIHLDFVGRVLRRRHMLEGQRSCPGGIPWPTCEF